MPDLTNITPITAKRCALGINSAADAQRLEDFLKLCADKSIFPTLGELHRLVPALFPKPFETREAA